MSHHTFAFARRVGALAAVAALAVSGTAVADEAMPPDPVPAFGLAELRESTGLDTAALVARSGLTEEQLRHFVGGAQVVGELTPEEVTELVVEKPELIAGTPVEQDNISYVGFGENPDLLGGATTRSGADRCDTGTGDRELCSGLDPIVSVKRQYNGYYVFCGGRPAEVCNGYNTARGSADLSNTTYAETAGDVDATTYSYPTSTWRGGNACDYSHDYKVVKNFVGRRLMYSRTDVYFCYNDPFEVTKADLYNEEAEPTTLGSTLGWDYDRRTYAENSCYRWYSNYPCSGRRVFRTYKFKRCIGPFGIGCIQTKYHKHKHFLHANGASYTDNDR